MNRGKVIDIENNKAIIMTDEFIFLNIRAKSEIEIGQKITFNEEDIIRPAVKFQAYAAIAAGLAAAITIIFIFFQFNMSRSEIYAYIDVDINPSLELSIDSNNRVAGVKPLNNDAERIINGIGLKKMSVSQAIEKIIDSSEKYGFMKKNEKNMVLISASLNPNIKENRNTVADSEKKLENVLYSINSEVEVDKENNISFEVIKVRSEERELSLKNKISMGRYIVYSKAIDNGIAINIEDARKIDVSLIWRKLNIDTENIKTTPTVNAGVTPKPTVDVLTTPTKSVYAPTAYYSLNTIVKQKGTPTQKKVQNTPVRNTPARITTSEPTRVKPTYAKPTYPMPKYSMPKYSVPTMPYFTEKPRDKNLIRNSGFEYGNASGWQIVNFMHWVVTKDEQYSGQFSIKLNGIGDWCPLIQQNDRLLPNTNYVYSFYGKCKPGSRVIFKVMEDYWGVPITKDYETTANDTWTKYSISFNSGFYSKVKLYLGDGGGEAYFDDFSLMESK